MISAPFLTPIYLSLLLALAVPAHAQMPAILRDGDRRMPPGADGSTITLNPGESKVIVIDNPGPTPLSSLAASLTGANAEEFTITGLPSTVAPRSFANLSILYIPTAEGSRSATLTLTSDAPQQSPRVIALDGRPLSIFRDSDGDGLNDMAEFRLAPLGFDWQVADPAKAQLIQDHSGDLHYITSAQLQTETSSTLIPLDPATGFKFRLTMEKSATLEGFPPWIIVPGNTSVLPGGGIGYRNHSPEEKAFYRFRVLKSE